MRIHSHALFTWALARRLRPSEPGAAAWGTVGSLVPDLPAIVGAAWLWAKHHRAFSREEFSTNVCGRRLFSGPDAALHSALPVVALLALYGASGAKERDRRGRLLAFLLGWAGHVLSDALTHVEDVRPVLWPLSKRRFGGPISYWNRAHHARPFAILEHAALLTIAARLLRRGPC